MLNKAKAETSQVLGNVLIICERPIEAAFISAACTSG